MLFPMNQVMILNAVVILVSALFIYSGFKQGFLIKAVGCLSFVVVALLSWVIAPMVADTIQIYPQSLTPFSNTVIAPFLYDSLNRIVVFFLLFFIVSLLSLLLRPLLKFLGNIPILSQINQLFGIVFGIIQTLIILMVTTLIFQTPIFANGKEVIANSVLKPVNALNEQLLFFVKDPMAQWESLQKIITPSNILNEQDYVNVESWMRSQDMSEEQIQDFLVSLRGNTNE